MAGGYEFDPEAAKRFEKGLRDAVAEMEEVGYFEITSRQGYGFSSLSMTGLAVGDAQLASDFAEFCDRWGLAVKEKIHDANLKWLAQGFNTLQLEIPFVGVRGVGLEGFGTDPVVIPK